MPLEIGGRFNVALLAGAFSEAGCDGGACSFRGGGKPRPSRPVSAMSASGVAASGAGSDDSSGASVTVTSPLGEACLAALGGLEELLDELAAPQRPAIMVGVCFYVLGIMLYVQMGIIYHES